MASQMTKQDKRAVVATKIHVAIDLLEKASTILDMAWQESAAERSLLYVSEVLEQARGQMLTGILNADALKAEYKYTEEHATRIK